MHPAKRPRAVVWVAFLVACVSATMRTAAAQISTSTLQGRVTDGSGVLPGATITVREIASGFTQDAVSDAQGSFTLPGLRPGKYEVRVVMDQFKPQAKTVELLVGQTITVDFRVTPDVIYTETVSVLADSRLVDTRTSEIATNVTEQQLRYLPQNSRNFLNFAALAPGVRVSDNEFRKEFSANGLPSSSVNVFIDGVSFKNDVIAGGVVGQDASRGNPFPQSAVQEFQVLTQNFKAEYEKAASAIITAVTKSGGNRFSGDVFNFYQDKALVQNEIMRRDASNRLVLGEGTPKPAYERWQWGVSLGGPIVRNQTQFFGSYEENRQDRAANVIVGSVTNVPAAVMQRVLAYEGLFVSPFREKLLFGKVSSQPGRGHRIEATYNWRNETDIRGFGGQGGSNSFETSENVKNRVDSAQGKWQVATSAALNEAYVSYQRYRWNPRPEFPDVIGENFQGLLRIGGRDTEQFIVQERISVRNDYSRFLSWRGNHTAKVGGIFSTAMYDVRKFLNGNPLFTYRGDISWNFPAEAVYGAGDPDLSATNYQFGIFVQDDWRAGNRLTLNLGLRWDYESDMLNNEHVTPAHARDAAAPFVDTATFTTDGDDRPPFYGALAPRLGFSYDVTGRGQTIAFGGWGRYYDRVLYNTGLTERANLQWFRRTFRFSADGLPRDGQPTLAWNPTYLSKAGLDAIIASGQAGTPELFLLDNETEPPVSDQWSLGMRHTVGGMVAAITYSGTRTRHLFSWIRGNRRADGTCCLPVQGFSNLFVNDREGRRAWFDGMYFQLDRPFGVGGSRYGFSVTYTLGRAEQIGGDDFSLDLPTVASYPRYPAGTDERHRLVMTGIVGLPWDFIASTFITLGSGTPYTITDNTLGSGPNQQVIRRNGGRPDQFAFIFPSAWAYRSVDLQVDKIFRFGPHQISAIVQAFNVFSFDNFSGYQGEIPTPPAVNVNFGRPSSLIDPGRRLQFGVRYVF
jgi:hypothetical protein